MKCGATSARSTPRGRRAKRLDKADDSAQHLLQVIKDILDLSKIEAGKTVPELAPDTGHLPTRLRNNGEQLDAAAPVRAEWRAAARPPRDPASP